MAFIDNTTKSELVILPARELAAGLRNGDFSARDVFDAYAFMVKNDKLNAFATDTTDKYRELTEHADANFKNGKARALEGIPFGSKALICSKGDESDACSNMLRGYVPEYDAFVIEKLKNDGALMLGQTNMDEFGMGSTTKNSCYGVTINPWVRNDDDSPMIAGGSSGGSAVAVASCMAPFCLGSDTGGSVRQPSALCGVVGIKPTYGLCSRWGITAYVSSMDQAGVIARDIRDAAWILSAIIGYDKRDPTSVDVPKVDYLSSITGDIRGMRIGVVQEMSHNSCPDVDAAYKKTIEILKNRGAEIVNINLPNIKYAICTYYVLACTESSSNLARYDGIRYGRRVEMTPDMDLNEYYSSVRQKYFGTEVKRRVLLGYYLSSIVDNGVSLHMRATALRALIYKEFRLAFDKVDAILSPTTSSGAYAISENPSPTSVYYNDMYTVPANLCGYPGLSVPFGLDAHGMPLGMQLIGDRFGELAILNIGAAIEDEVCFTRPKPRLVKF